MAELTQKQLEAVAEAALTFVSTLTSYEARELLDGRKSLAVVEACPRCRHTADNPWAHCKCLDEECVCAVEVVKHAGPSLWRTEGKR